MICSLYKRALLAFISLLLFKGCSPSSQGVIYSDVCVYGGSEAAFTAAIQAARMGKTVLLIEPTGHSGGMAVEGISGDIRFGSSAVIGGLAKDFYTRVEHYYGREPDFGHPTWRSYYEPHVAEMVVNTMLESEDIRVLKKAKLVEGQKAVLKKGNRIERIILENGQEIAAKIFIDASIEGDLLHFAGITTETIREGNKRYGETKNGIRTTNTYRQFAVKVDPFAIPGDETSGLIATIQEGKSGEEGAPDPHIQGFCFRLCLTNTPDNVLPIQKPENYQRSDYEIYDRYLAAGGELFSPQGILPNNKTDLGSWHDLSANLYGENADYPAGDYQTKKQIIDYHRTFTQGLIWYLQNDPSVPERTEKRWRGWGLCQDEFQDNGGWPRRLYIRSARRMVSEYVITELHSRRDNDSRVSDPVAIAWWPTDVHHARRIVVNGYAYNEGFTFNENDWRPFGISYRALVPKKTECSNLISPTCPSSSYIAYGAIRIVPTFMMLGQSAGTMAALAIDFQQDVQDLGYEKLQQELLNQGQILEIPVNWLDLITYGR